MPETEILFGHVIVFYDDDGSKLGKYPVIVEKSRIIPGDAKYYMIQKIGID